MNRFTGALFALALLLVAALAFATPPGGPGSTASTGTPATSRDHIEESQITQDKLGSDYKTGLAPMPNDEKTPRQWLPPGSNVDDTGPSTVIFPMQSITIRFNHRFHLTDQGVKCDVCHIAAAGSESAKDYLLPPPKVCDNCHFSDHSDLAAVKAGGDKAGQCAFCHNGYKPEHGNTVAKNQVPPSNMVMNHKKHLARNINCQQCHGDVQNLELATRDQLPRMKGCFSCHQKPDSAARGEAKAACDTCHIRATNSGGRIENNFASGALTPPRWLHNAAHTPDWIDRHKLVAGADSSFCSNCHKEDFCVGCHDGRVRPRSVHPNDYIRMHPIDARLETTKCTSCHREQSFCIQCHQRTGVAMSSPAAARNSGRFHPPKETWSNAPRKPGHHAIEAQRNLNQCVACHTERDCVACHGGQGVGAGFNPHRGNFLAKCNRLMERNSRPCFVCHQPGDAVLNQCR